MEVRVATLLNPGSPAKGLRRWGGNPSPTAAVPRTHRTLAPLHLWHLASFDAPTVAVVWAWSLGWAAHLRPAPWATAALVLIVWFIYIVDRLLDARAGLRTPPAHTLRDRHWFHWRHRRILLPLAILAAIAAAALVLTRLPMRALRPDSFVAAATLLWLGSVHFGTRHSAKTRERIAEIIVALIFVTGCALPVLPQNPAAFARLALAPALLFAAAAWLNLHAINAWETEPSAAPGQSSGCSRIRSSGIAVAAIGFILAACAIPLAGARTAALLDCAACSALLLALLDRQRNRMSPTTLRAAADLVLLTPILLAPAIFLIH
jgi:hypothetical protein